MQNIREVLSSLKALTPNPLLQHSWRANQLVINQFNMCSLYFLYYPNSSMKIPDQALNTRVYRGARAWGYFILVDVLPFISIPSCPLNLSWLCRATPDIHKGNMNSRQSPSCRSFPSLPLITQKSVYKHMSWFQHTKSTHSPITTAHAVTGRETQTRRKQCFVWWVRFNTVISYKPKQLHQGFVRTFSNRKSTASR